MMMELTRRLPTKQLQPEYPEALVNVGMKSVTNAIRNTGCGPVFLSGPSLVSLRRSFAKWFVLKKSFSSLSFITTHHCNIESNPPELISISNDGKKILETPNAGGSSIWSEVFSFELLHLLLGAKLSHTEMEIDYVQCSKITDFSIQVFGSERIGVSVTRALKFKGLFTEEDAKALLTKKLHGINESTQYVSARCRWERQILHIFVIEPYICEVLKAVFQNDIADELKSNTLVICSVTDSRAEWIYWGVDRGKSEDRFVQFRRRLIIVCFVVNLILCVLNGQ